MSEGAKTPETPKSTKSVDFNVEKQDNEKNAIIILEEPLEKIKEKVPPGINASLVLLYAVFFSMFTIGWVNLNSCSVSRLIPIYLIVAGFLGAVAKVISKIGTIVSFYATIILVILDVIWNILGSYWVYKEYQPNYDPQLGIYCNRTAYLLAFWIITIQYTLIGFFVLLSACYMMMRGDFKK